MSIVKKILNKYEKFIEEIDNQNSIKVKSKYITDFMYFMKNDEDLSYDILCDHTVVDWIDNNTFDLIYNLYSTKLRENILFTTTIPRDKPIIETISNIWKIAEWQEREAFDLFGILYKNHKDLRRLFLEDDWVGFPLRKDYKDNFILEI